MTREIVITPVLNGFVCKVGCQKVVFQSISGLIAGLNEYFHDPEKTEKKFINDAVNKMEANPVPCEPTPCDVGRGSSGNGNQIAAATMVTCLQEHGGC